MNPKTDPGAESMGESQQPGIRNVDLVAKLEASHAALFAAIQELEAASCISTATSVAARQAILAALHALEGSGVPGQVDLSVLTESLTAREAEIRDLAAKLGRERVQAAKVAAERANEQRELAAGRAEIALLRGSFAFRLGHALVAAVRSPRGAIVLPLRLAGLLRQGAPRIMRRLWRVFSPRVRDDSPDLGPEFSLPGTIAPAPEPQGADAMVERLRAGTGGASKLPKVQSELRLATIMDEFSFNAFLPCCRMLALQAGGWREQMEEFEPHLLLVESAWKGHGESWARKVYPLSGELMELVAWCRERSIPTVFWNKEDPVHLSVFMRTARQFDFVFTTDVDCVRAYKAALRHDQVYWLPFACQPMEHNPIEEYERKDAFCFAGSYYAKYPERQRNFQTLVDAVAQLRPCEIFDRNAGKGDPALEYPEQYGHMIQGALPYNQISLAYKGYRFGINLNTVKQSQSMFARRAFELLACNTVTVSNFSRGLRLLFGDLVVSSDDGRELLARLGPLVQDEAYYRRFRLAGLRKVLSEHTYQDRLRYMLEKVGGTPRASGSPQVAVVAAAADETAARRILDAFARQAYPNRVLWLSVPSEVLSALSPMETVRLLGHEEAAKLDATAIGADWIAGFSADDYYGPYYLTDLVLATRYCSHRVIGKQARHRAEAGVVRPVDLASAYVPASEPLPLRRALVVVAQVAERSLGWLGGPGLDAGLAGAMAIDEFNYCESGAETDCRQADDLQGLSTGVDLGRFQALAETSEAPAGPFATKAPDIDAATIAGWLPPAPDGVTLRLEGDRFLLRSILADTKHTYLYARQILPVDALFPARLGRLHFAVDTEMLLSFVLIFLDANRQRIGHAIRACSSNISMIPPAGTRFVRFGLRVQGSGEAAIRGMFLDHLPSPVVGIPGSGRHLLVSRGYPAYDNLYSYAYVHRRVQGYRSEGLGVDVFRIADGNLAFAEFEGVDVVTGGLSDLETVLRSNDYSSILVHSLDRALWSVLQAHAGSRRVIAWVHGAEIQPWYRRDFSFLDAKDRERGIQRSVDRMAFWQELLAEWPGNLHLVFVSRHLVREVERDLGIELDPARYDVIHNHIDGSLFRYRPKEVAQRTRILSIRPYSRPTYANDLAVKAILDLSAEPYFGELEFRLVGDGRLFEQTVEPLRGMDNVHLDRRFLSQREIAELHGEYGVFLTPTRIDSQGVSRDEAMASGLVPVTSAVSAVPEFVAPQTGFLAGAEDWRSLADAIRTLYREPGRFAAMSAAAAARVRAQSGREATLLREVALIRAPDALSATTSAPRAVRRIALYGDLDLNLIDGSAVWAASLAEVLAGIDGVEVDLFLKTPIRSTEMLRGLLDKVNVRLVEPPREMQRMTIEQALDRIQAGDALRNYDAVIVRGFDLAHAAVQRPALSARLWVYLTDIPTSASDFDQARREALVLVVRDCGILLCQTPQLEAYLHRLVPAAANKTQLLPPMIPDFPLSVSAVRNDGILRIAYAGKFSPQWGIREMLDAIADLRAEGRCVELHVFGDKIHNPPGDPGFQDEVRARLGTDAGVTWHRGLDRRGVLEQLPGMDIGWAWRHASLEQSTLELSTKVLEYAACGLAPLLAHGPVNRELLGDDYPFYAERNSLLPVLRKALMDKALIHSARAKAASVAGAHFFSAVAEAYLQPLLSEWGDRQARAPGQGSEAFA